MGITISGENNNDRILASDGVIDQLSGFNVVGVMTATSFTGDLTGDVTGNLTGNVTGNINNSTLLLQTGGSERFRITGNNELGIAGANYGSSGQVLTSGGSGSAVSWATPAVTGFTNGSNNRVVTATSGSGLNGEANLTFDGVNLQLGGSTFYIKNAMSDSNGLKISQESSDESRIFNHYSGPLTIGTANLERLRITSTGEVLIGTSDAGHSSADDLTINNSGNGGITIRTGTTSNGAIFFADSTSGDARFDGFVQYNHGSSPYMLFGTSGDERLRIASNGDLTNTLQATSFVTTKAFSNLVKLDIRGTNIADSNHYILSYGEGHANDHEFHMVNTVGDIAFRTGASSLERLRINSSGQVSLGNNPTVASDAALHIELDGSREYLRLNADAGNNNAYIEIQADDNRRKALIFKSGGTRRGVIGVGDSDEAANATSLFFSASSNIAGNSPHMVITSTGKVGINEDVPQATLHVRDSIPELRLTNTTTPNQVESGRIRFTEYETARMQGAFIHYDGNANKLHLGVHPVDDNLASNDINAITIDRAAGIVGIGEDSPNIRLTVIGSGSDNLVRLGRSDASDHASHTVNIKISKDYYHNLKMESSSYRFDTYDGSSMNHRMNIPSNGQIQILGGGNVFQLNPGGNAGTLVFNQGGVITSNIRSSDGGSNVAGGSGGGSRLFLSKNEIYMYTYNYLSNIGDAPSYAQRFRIDTSGNFHGSSSNNISDQRLKKDIATITDPLTKIKGLIGRTFKWKEDSTKFDDKTKYGFIAQEVETTIPELVDTENGIVLFDKDDKVIYDEEAVVSRSKSVNETGLIPITVEALKVLISKVETLEAKVAALEGS